MLTNAAVVADEPSGVDFVTAACVVHRPRRREVTWALAGHPAPLRLDDGTPLPTALIGPPIGIDEQFDIAAAAAPLRAGDGVLVYTDGIVEARSATGELFGDRRLSRALAALRGLAPADTVDGLRREIEAFTGGPFDDDVCMIALRARPTMADGEAEEVCSPNLVAPLPDDAAA
jgi:serine phosphatase RsbU (regulator of sigma subunit)